MHLLTKTLLTKRLFHALNDTITKTSSSWHCRQYAAGDKKDGVKKESIAQKLFILNRDYWHVMFPIHFVTSAMWMGGIYYAATTGVDIVGLMESWHFKEWMVAPLKDSHHLGLFALSFAVYQLISPLRSVVTFILTAWAVKRLLARGYIKPIPIKTPKQLKAIKKKVVLTAKQLKEKQKQLKRKPKKLKDKQKDEKPEKKP